MSSFHQHYKAMRDKGLPANQAIVQARYEVKNDELRAEFSALEAQGHVRFRTETDDCYNLDDLMGDCFNPDANPSVPASQLKREENEFVDRVEREGVYGIITEYYDGEEWMHADSVWGFVGDDWKLSGYDADLMGSAIDNYRRIQHCPCCKQVIPQK